MGSVGNLESKTISRILSEQVLNDGVIHRAGKIGKRTGMGVKASVGF